MSFAVMVCLALLVTIGYFLVLFVGETISWIISRVIRAIEERRYQTPAHSI